jgi:hypothetical protein
VLLGFLQYGFEAGEQLQAHRHETGIHRDGHGILLVAVGGVRGAILAVADESGKARQRAPTHYRPASSTGFAEPARPPSCSEDRRNPMIKALLTPIILGLAVAMVIRVAMPRRAY